MYDDKTVVEIIEAKFPALSEELHDETWGGLLHLQIGVLAHFAQSVIDDGDRETWQEICRVFGEIWKSCTPEVMNALNVSFLEHLNFKDKKEMRSWAYRSMPPAMRKAWDDMDEYNRKLRGG
jgi:hypothetical protein